MTWNDGGGGGAYSSMDGNGFFYAMANTGYCRFDPPSGATPHEFGHVWEGSCGGLQRLGQFRRLVGMHRQLDAAPVPQHLSAGRRLYLQRHVLSGPRPGLLRFLDDLGSGQGRPALRRRLGQQRVDQLPTPTSRPRIHPRPHDPLRHLRFGRQGRRDEGPVGRHGQEDGHLGF